MHFLASLFIFYNMRYTAREKPKIYRFSCVRGENMEERTQTTKASQTLVFGGFVPVVILAD